MATPDIPKKQKAAVFDQPGTVSTKVVEIDVPEPGAGQVLINLLVYPRRLCAAFPVLIHRIDLIPAYATLTMES